MRMYASNSSAALRQSDTGEADSSVTLSLVFVAPSERKLGPYAFEPLQLVPVQF